MTTGTIGSPMPTYIWYLRRGGNQGAIINFYSDADLTVPKNEMDGEQISILIGSDPNNPIKQFDAVCVGNTATFVLDNDDTADLQFALYDGSIRAEDLTPLINLRVEIGPD